MITPAAFSVFVTNVNTMIGQAYGTTPVMYPNFATTIPVSSLIWEGAWTGMLDKMRAWYGSRVVTEPAAQTYSVTMIPYEQTRAIDRFALDDDMFGVYYRMLPDMARQAKRWPDYLMRDLLEGTGEQTGSRQNGLDGLTHWNTAHPVDLYDASKGTYPNDFTAGGQTVSGILVGGAFSPTAFATLREFMRTLKGEDNEPLGIMPDLLMVSPFLETEAELVLKSLFFAPPAWGSITGQVGAADNPLRRFGVEYIVNPLLKTSPKIWYMMDTSKPMKPFLWLLREAPIFTPRVAENDPFVFDQHKYVWGAWGRGAPGWNLAWLSARSGP